MTVRHQSVRRDDDRLGTMVRDALVINVRIDLVPVDNRCPVIIMQAPVCITSLIRPASIPVITLCESSVHAGASSLMMIASPLTECDFVNVCTDVSLVSVPLYGENSG